MKRNPKRKKKPFRELEFSDAFMFAATMEDEGKFINEKDWLLNQIQSRIARIKSNHRMEGNYMLFGEMLDDERKEGREEGRQESREENRKLFSVISLEDFKRLQSDFSLMDELLKKYNIENSNSNQ